MDCFQDFCLACDKQCTEGSYCSQACRLAELEKASNAPTSPTTPAGFEPSYALLTAYGFPFQDQKKFSVQSEKALSPSSSRTSLSSTTSSSSSGTGLTKQARAELQDYFTSFDQTRAAKRRSSLR